MEIIIIALLAALVGVIAAGVGAMYAFLVLRD